MGRVFNYDDFFYVMLKMDGRVVGLNLIGRKMRTWPESGTTQLGNGMVTPMTKVILF